MKKSEIEKMVPGVPSVASILIMHNFCNKRIEAMTTSYELYSRKLIDYKNKVREMEKGKFIMDKVNEYLKKNYKEHVIGYFCYPGVTKAVICNDGYRVSIQANEYTYCTPRENKAWPYTAVELGFPSCEDELINDFAEDHEDYTKTVYGYVPIDIVNKLIEKHGGIKE